MKYISVLLLFCIPLVSINNIFAQKIHGGYCHPFSVVQGDSLTFYISTSKDTFDLSIYKIGASDKLIATYKSLRGGIKPIPDSSYYYGCNWTSCLSIKTPVTWEPGLYKAMYPDSSLQVIINFIIKEDTLGSKSSIAFLLGTNTVQAYNQFGGRSFYGSTTMEDVKNLRTYKASFLRPTNTTSEYEIQYMKEISFLKWFNTKQFSYECFSDLDLDNIPNVLDNYKVLIITWHPEYWSMNERLEIQRFLDKGGKIMFLSGNACWWQVRYEENYTRLVCYKDKKLDPLYGIKDSLVTINWSSPPVNLPENSLLGVSFRNGGYVNYNKILPKTDGYGSYAAYNSHYWIYEGTGLEDGNKFGNAIVGYESDGALFSWKEGIPVVTGVDKSPSNYRILGLSPAADSKGKVTGHATMGMYYNKMGGAVFSAASTGWTYGCYTNDSIVSRITLNVLNKFLSNKFPPEIIGWGPFKIDTATINKDLVYLNKRNLYMIPNDSVKFFITTSKQFTNTKYYWEKNGEVVSYDSVYWFYNTLDTSFIPITIKAYAYNSVDTSSISWTVNTTLLKIISTPPVIHNNTKNYHYKLKVYNYRNDKVSFELPTAPSWLNINGDGELFGTIPNQKDSMQIISVRAFNQFGEQDTQTFNLSDFIQNETGIIVYPNPMITNSTIQFLLEKKSIVNLRAFNIMGETVKYLLYNQRTEAGIYSLSWDLKNDGGKKISEGIYFIEFSAFPVDNSSPFLIRKKIIVLR